MIGAFTKKQLPSTRVSQIVNQGSDSLRHDTTFCKFSFMSGSPGRGMARNNDLGGLSSFHVHSPLSTDCISLNAHSSVRSLPQKERVDISKRVEGTILLPWLELESMTFKTYRPATAWKATDEATDEVTIPVSIPILAERVILGCSYTIKVGIAAIVSTSVDTENHLSLLTSAFIGPQYRTLMLWTGGSHIAIRCWCYWNVVIRPRRKWSNLCLWLCN